MARLTPAVPRRALDDLALRTPALRRRRLRAASQPARCGAPALGALPSASQAAAGLQPPPDVDDFADPGNIEPTEDDDEIMLALEQLQGPDGDWAEQDFAELADVDEIARALEALRAPGAR